MSAQDERIGVLELIDGFREGGAERQAVQLTRLVHETGRYRVRVACLDRSGPLLPVVEALGTGEIPEYSLTSFYDVRMALQLRRFVSFLRRERISVVHTHDFYTNIFGMLGARLAGVPARIAARGETGGIRTRTQKRTELAAYRLANLVIANAGGVRSHLVAEGMDPDRVSVVYNGLGQARVAPASGLERAERLARLGLPADAARRLVTILANLRLPVKDHPTFLRAAARVAALVPDVGFVVAGEGDLLDPMRALALELGVADRVFFIGRCDMVSELLAVSDVGVLSSIAEGFSNVILEYMGAALPVVATNVGGASEAVVEGETGFLVEPGDDAAMAERIVRVLADTDLARTMGAVGRDLVHRRFSLEAQVDGTTAIYDRLLDEVRSSRRATVGRGAAA